jgi:hypothetical protein
MDNYCEYIQHECDYTIICKRYSKYNVCVKDLLGEYFNKPGYYPEDILNRIKRYEERDKLNKELESK